MEKKNRSNFLNNGDKFECEKVKKVGATKKVQSNFTISQFLPKLKLEFSWIISTSPPSFKTEPYYPFSLASDDDDDGFVQT